MSDSKSYRSGHYQKMYLTCPQCHSNHVTKNGFNRLKKQLYKCQDCGRQFVLHPAKGPVSQETRELIDRLLLEKISLAGIARAVKVSEAWLQNYVNEKYKKVPRQVALKKNGSALTDRFR